MKPMFRLLRYFFDSLLNALYLWRAGARLRLIAMYLSSRRRSSANKIFNKYGSAIAEMRVQIADNAFSHDWFTPKIPHWMEIFDQYGLRDRPIIALEIGSYEGLSACFILRQLPLASLTCVDAWANSNEYTDIKSFSTVEESFDRNIAPWRSRVTKYKGMSFSYFSTLENEKFDFIYIDGSHHADDIIADAVRGFTYLKVGGVMIFDDYLWLRYPRLNENPATAINAFLRLIEGRYRPVMVNYQLALVKTEERSVPAERPAP